MIIERIKRRKKTYGLIFLFLILAIVISLYKDRKINYIGKNYLINIKVPKNSDRVLIVAPHCDDETLGAGELIENTIKNGGKVKVIVVTNGDGFTDAIELNHFKFRLKSSDYVGFGYTRQKESVKALEYLGVKKQDIIFLGYPDGGMEHLWRNNWDKTNPYTSRFTKTNINPYENSFSKASAYAGENVIADISKILKDYKPTYIVFPHPNDKHPDHWAVNGFIKYVLTYMKYSPQKELLYLVHRGDWPTPMRTDKDLYLVPPFKLVFKGTEWFKFNLNKNEIERKEKAIHLYNTQIKVLRPLMTAFERKNELFGEYINLKLPNNKKSDKDVEADNKNRIISDPLQDTLYLDFRKETDISDIHAEISKELNLHIFIKIDGTVGSSVLYNLDLILFRDNSTSRLTLGIKNNKIQIYNYTNQSITNGKDIKLITENNSIHLLIPKEVTREFNHLMINSYSQLQDHFMDKTAWRRLDIE